MTGIAPFYHERYFDSIGKPLSGGKLYFYSAGSQIPKSIFTNKELTIPATNPIILDSSGLAIQYFLDDGFYDIVITDQFNNIIDTPKNISSIQQAGSNNTGSIVISGDSGWVYYNSGTSALSTSASTLPKADNSGFLHYNIGTSAYSWENVQTDSYKVKVDQFDTEDYLNEKVISGDGIDVVNLTEATRKLQINSQGKVKTSDVDSLDYLNTKFINSETINFSENSNKMSASIVTSAVLDGKLKVDQYDTIPNYLSSKLADSDTVIWEAVDNGGNKSYKANIIPQNVTGDRKVVVDVEDLDVPGYLVDKIAAGTGPVTVTVEQAGQHKQLHINIFDVGKISVSENDSYNYLNAKIKAGSGITITSASDINGESLWINSKTNIWRSVNYKNTNYTINDTTDTIGITGPGVTITLPDPSETYNGRIVYIYCTGTGTSCTISNSFIVGGSSSISDFQKAELICLAGPSGWVWLNKVT